MIDWDRYEAVFFDAGGTLFYPYPSVGEIYGCVAGRYGCRAEPAEIEARFREVWLRHDGLGGLVSKSSEKIEKEWWHELVTEVFSGFPPIRGFESFFEELYLLFGSPSVWRLYPSVKEILAAFKQRGKVLGMISNWDSRLFQLCEGLGLKPYFDFILASAVFGAAKPSPKIFREALYLAGVEPDRAVHIGDSYADDVRGCLAVGIQPVLINRHPERKDFGNGEELPVPVFHDLAELPDLPSKLDMP
ncbi:MAG: HAD-IA family hydrolase [Candidatus Omnitrophota bacterium]